MTKLENIKLWRGVPYAIIFLVGLILFVGGGGEQFIRKWGHPRTDVKETVHRGTVYLDKGEYDLAIQNFNEAIRLNPRYADAFYRRGFARWFKGENGLAIQDYSEAIKIDQNHVDALSRRGFVLRSIGNADRANQDLNHASMDPGRLQTRLRPLQSAAVMARYMKRAGHDVVHLSTALCPRDRNAILKTVQERLAPEQKYPANWTLVATSLMEAGVDLSFRTPFRERFATTSLIQIGGRGNRNFEWPQGVDVHDFTVSYTEGLTEHPEARTPASVLEDMFAEGILEGEVDAARLVTLAIGREMNVGAG